MRAGDSHAEKTSDTRAVEQKKLARAAMARLAGERMAEAKFPNSKAKFGKKDEKDNGIKVELAGWRPVGESKARVISMV
jgi:hypothetical protein